MKHPLAQAYDQYLENLEISREIKNSARRTFGATLRMTRKNLKMSVRELGDKVGITGSLINQIEMTGKSILKKPIIERIVELCYAAKNHSEQKQVSEKPENESNQSALDGMK